MKKILFFIHLCIMISCSTHTRQTGGEYAVDLEQIKDLKKSQLKSEAFRYVKSLDKDPPVGKHGEIFASGKFPLKRIGLLILESRIQPTLAGYAKEDSIYLSDAGKQILVEKSLKIWEDSAPLIFKDITFVSLSEIALSKKYQEYGSKVEDHLKANTQNFAPDNIFYLNKGSKTTQMSLALPRITRDFSQFFVPATQLMDGPKYSEHQKHLVNDLAIEYNLDAVMLVYQEINWSIASQDKRTKEVSSEEMTLNIDVNLLIPFTRYHQRLNETNPFDRRPKVNIVYKKWEFRSLLPLDFMLPQEDWNFSEVQSRLINPLFTHFVPAIHLVMSQMQSDIEKTF